MYFNPTIQNLRSIVHVFLLVFTMDYNMSTIHQININSEGLIYVNANLKIHALLFTLANKNAARSEALLQTGKECGTDECLGRVEKELALERTRRQQMEKALSSRKQEYLYDYVLCGDLVFENDIKVCRRKVKQNYLEKLAALMQGHL